MGTSLVVNDEITNEIIRKMRQRRRCMTEARFHDNTDIEAISFQSSIKVFIESQMTLIHLPSK